MKTIVLASASVRRQALFRKAGIPFEVVVSHCDEDMSGPLPPGDLALELSAKKAWSVASMVQKPCLIVAADTVVAQGANVFGKPKNASDAFRILKALQGKSHTVYTGVTFIDKEEHETRTKQLIKDTGVTMRVLTDGEIQAYVQTGEPMDKAGAYAIQEAGWRFIESIHGDYYNIVGLPLLDVYMHLKIEGFIT